jgi:tetratricopeptide (TPR) repeat protein
MTMNTRRILLVAAILIGGIPVAAQAKISDIVVSKNGRRIRGVEVTEMTASTIKYRRDDQQSELPASLLSHVVWHEPPESFTTAMGEFRSGKFAEAANLFAEAAQRAERTPLKQEAQFMAAESLLRGSARDQAKAVAAVDALRGYMKDAPDGYRTPNALLLLGSALLLAGQAAEAEQVLAQLANDSLAKNWGTAWDARAKLQQAKALIAQGKAADARSRFRAAISAAEVAAAEKPDPELLALKAEAAVGEGETFIAEKKLDEALTFFRDLANRSSGAGDREIRAAARAGEAEALYLKAVAQKSPDGLRAAQVALAEANLLDLSSGTTTAKALYYSGKVLLELPADRQTTGTRPKAMAYFESAVRNYGDTPWAQKARDELGR